MRWTTGLVVICLLATSAVADDEARRAQINAATTDAFDTLRRQVLSTSLGGELTIDRFLDRIGGRDTFDATLQTAQQIGGTRWLDEQTVQVRLEIRGDDVGLALERIADKTPRALPISMHALRDRVKKDFSRRTFSATGTSTAASVADRLRPDPSQVAWRAVSDKDRRAAVDAARKTAVERVMDSLRSVEWDYGKRHLADALAVPAVQESVHDWLAARPITSIEFRDDLEVRISLAASPRDLWPMLQAGLAKQAAVSVPHDQKEWDALHRQVENRMVPAVGTALAQPTGPAARVPVLQMPAAAPSWASDDSSAEGIANSVEGSKLKTARAAEAIALDRLRGRLNALPLDQTTTLGEAARKDPRIENALRRSIQQAHISKVDYDNPTPGSVRVRMVLDLQSVWRELTGR